MDTLPSSLRNHLLIAMPGLNDPNFAHSVTYLCEHDEHGALGIVINAPLSVTWGELLSQMELPPGPRGEEPVVLGGPVQPDHGFVLHGAWGEWQSTLAITPEVHLTTSVDILTALAHGTGPRDCLVALGYAGWGAGQLEQELADNAWLTCEATPDILFRLPFEQRLDASLKLLGIDPGMLSSQAGHA